ncbi:MAG: hypothetical protein IKZ82_07490 [Clostridia bacterium]|nr:hypothetical protein [Clostridia bacterium]
MAKLLIRFFVLFYTECRVYYAAGNCCAFAPPEARKKWVWRYDMTDALKMRFVFVPFAEWGYGEGRNMTHGRRKSLALAY